MSLAKVEERVLVLEQTVARLAQSQRDSGRIKDWRRTVGMFSGNELMKEIDAAGRQIREQDRQRARERGTSRRRTGK